MFFFLKKNWTDFVSCARAGLVGNIGKFPEKSVKEPKYRRFFEILLRLLRRQLHSRFIGRNIDDFADFLTILLEIDNRVRISGPTDIRYFGEQFSSM